MECYFCKNNLDSVDYRNTTLLKRFVSGLYKIKGREKTGLCAKHQRRVARAIKRARQMALMPYMPE